MFALPTFLGLLIAGLFGISALVLGILSLIKKMKARKILSILSICLAGVGAISFAFSLAFIDVSTDKMKNNLSEIQSNYNDSKNSLDNVKISFGKFNYTKDRDNYEQVDDAKLKVILTNNNKQSVNGTIKFLKTGNNSTLDGYSNYVDFDIPAGESKTYTVLTGVEDLKTAKDFATSKFYMDKSGSYSYFDN